MEIIAKAIIPRQIWSTTMKIVLALAFAAATSLATMSAAQAGTYCTTNTVGNTTYTYCN